MKTHLRVGVGKRPSLVLDCVRTELEKLAAVLRELSRGTRHSVDLLEGERVRLVVESPGSGLKRSKDGWLWSLPAGRWDDVAESVLMVARTYSPSHRSLSSAGDDADIIVSCDGGEARSMKAKAGDSVELLVAVQDSSKRMIAAGTRGVVVEAYAMPSEGYAVDLRIPDASLAGGARFENVVLSPDQFGVVPRSKKHGR